MPSFVLLNQNTTEIIRTHKSIDTFANANAIVQWERALKCQFALNFTNFKKCLLPRFLLEVMPSKVNFRWHLD